MPRLLLALVILLMAFPRSYAAEVRVVPTGEVRTPSDEEGPWKMHRKLGDEFAAKGDYKNAAANYRKVLSDAGPALTTGERLRMATVLSWGGELEAAIRELESILQAEPGNLQARLQLARSLSWAGKTGEAIAVYEDLVQRRADSMVFIQSQFALARLYESQNKLDKALALYDSVAQEDGTGTFGSEAGFRSVELRAKNPALAKPAAALTDMPATNPKQP